MPDEPFLWVGKSATLDAEDKSNSDELHAQSHGNAQCANHMNHGDFLSQL
jgi:hypothetical protein